MGSNHWNEGDDMVLLDEVFKEQEGGTGNVGMDQYEIRSDDSASNEQLSEDDGNSESEEEEEVDSLSDESGAESCYTGVQNESDSDMEDPSVRSGSIDSELATESIESEQGEEEEEEEEEVQSDSVISDYRHGAVQLQQTGIDDLSDSESTSTESDESIESDDSVAESIESDDSVARESIDESEQEKKAESDNVISDGQTAIQSRNMDAAKLSGSESEPEEDECDLESYSSPYINPSPTFFTQNTAESPPDKRRSDSGGSSVRSRVTTSNIVSVEPDLSLNLCSDGGIVSNPRDVESKSSVETNTMKKLNAEVVSERHDMKVLESTADSVEVTGIPPIHHSFESAQIEHQVEKTNGSSEVNDTTSLLAEAKELSENLSVRELVNKLMGSSVTMAEGGGSKEGDPKEFKEQEGEPLPLGNGEMISCCSSSSTKTNDKEEAHEKQENEQKKEVVGYPEKDKATEPPEWPSAHRAKISEGAAFTVAGAGYILNREEVGIKRKVESLGETADYEKYMPLSRINSPEVHKGICSADDDAECSPNIESTDQMLQVIECGTVHETVAESMEDEQGFPQGNGLEIASMDVTNTVRTGNVKMLREGEKSMLCKGEKSLLSVTKCTEISDCDPNAVGQKHMLTKEAMVESVKTSYVHTWKQEPAEEIRLLPLDESTEMSTEMSVSMMKPYEESTLCDGAYRTGARNPEPEQNETTMGKAISSTPQLKLSNMSSSSTSITSSRNIEECVMNGTEPIKKKIMDANENGGTGTIKCEEKWHKKDGEVVLSGIVSLSQQTSLPSPQSLPEINNTLVENPVVINSSCALHGVDAQQASLVARLHAKAREEAVKRRVEATERENATRLHLNTLKKGSVSSKMARFKGTESYAQKFDDYIDVHHARVNDKGRGVRGDFKLSPIRKKNIKQHQGLVDNNNVFRDQTVTVAPSSLTATGQKSGGGGVGYVSSYRRRILEERQRNKTAKSLQQKALDNKRLNAAQYSDAVRRKAKLRAAKHSQLRSEMSAEPLSNVDVLSNLQVQVQNKPHETTVWSDDDYHSTPITRRKQLITTETERIKQQKAARDQANQQMRQQFYKRREKHTSSNITSSGAYNTAIVRPKNVGGEERPSPVLNEVPFQPSDVNEQFLYEKRLADIEAKVYGHRMAYANRKLLSCQTSSSQPSSHWNKSHHNAGSTINRGGTVRRAGAGTSPSSTTGRPPYKGGEEKQYVSRDDFIARGYFTNW